MRFEEAPATAEENWYDYRLEWDKHISDSWETMKNNNKPINYGPGSDYYTGFDAAWDRYKDLQKNPWFLGVRLIKLNPKTGEEISR